MFILKKHLQISTEKDHRWLSISLQTRGFIDFSIYFSCLRLLFVINICWHRLTNLKQNFHYSRKLQQLRVAFSLNNGTTVEGTKKGQCWDICLTLWMTSIFVFCSFHGAYRTNERNPLTSSNITFRQREKKSDKFRKAEGKKFSYMMSFMRICFCCSFS